MRDLWIPTALVLGLFIAQVLVEAWLRRRIERAEEQRRAAWVAAPVPTPVAAPPEPAAVAAELPAPAVQSVAPSALAVTPVVARRRAHSTPVAPRKRATVRPRFESTAT